MKKILSLALIMCLIALSLTACGRGKLGDRYDKAQAENDQEMVEMLDEKIKNRNYDLVYWKLVDKYVESTQEDVNRDDEWQKVRYIFKCGTQRHNMTLDYEPLTNDKGESSKIPAYTQKVECVCGEMPAELFNGKSYTIDVGANYLEKNDYAGISADCWLYSDNDSVKITCNEGYAKGEIYAGDRGEGVRDSFNATFTLTAPEETTDDNEDFIIYFESTCGKTAYKYTWVSE